jgi:hypothetical protein
MFPRYSAVAIHVGICVAFLFSVRLVGPFCLFADALVSRACQSNSAGHVDTDKGQGTSVPGDDEYPFTLKDRFDKAFLSVLDRFPFPLFLGLSSTIAPGAMISSSILELVVGRERA